MGRVARIEPADRDGNRWLLYYCPGCRSLHTVPEGRWTWSGDMENAPTLNPSVRPMVAEPWPSHEDEADG